MELTLLRHFSVYLYRFLSFQRRFIFGNVFRFFSSTATSFGRGRNSTKLVGFSLAKALSKRVRISRFGAETPFYTADPPTVLHRRRKLDDLLRLKDVDIMRRYHRRRRRRLRDRSSRRRYRRRHRRLIV